jgi:ketosteroid isomerase-like protein
LGLNAIPDSLDAALGNRNVWPSFAKQNGEYLMRQRLMRQLQGRDVFMALYFLLSLAIGSDLWADDPELDKKLKSIVAVQQSAWNEGNLDKFMDAYWKSDKLTFSSRGETRRGWQTTLEKYKKSYPDRATMGKLTFSNLEVESLSADVAMMLGEWKIEGEKPADGNFSLVWRRIDGQWVIIHDHSSSRDSN